MKVFLKNQFLIVTLILFILLNIEKINSDEDIYNFDLDGTVAFTLFNGNIILFSSKGFFTFDSKLSSLYNYTFSSELSLGNYIKRNYPSFTQFSENEDGYVMCYLLKNLYIFNKEGEFIFLTDANETSIIDDKTYNNYVINAYKKENSEYYYTIVTYGFLNIGHIYYFYYKINLNYYTKTLIYNNIYYNSSEQLAYSNTICCQKMLTNNNNKYLTCFYQYSKQDRNLIGEISFEPDNNFTFLEPRKSIILDNNNFDFAVSVNNEDNSKAYICSTSGSTNANCFYYDINTREFSEFYSLGYTCKSYLYVIYLNYFRNKKEFVFSCVNDYFDIYSIVKFKENFTVIQPDNYGIYRVEECNYIYSLSIIYSTQDKDYILFSSASYNNSPRKNIKYSLASFFNSTNKLEIDSTFITKTNQIVNSNQITELSEAIISNRINDSHIKIKSTIVTELIENNKLESSLLNDSKENLVYTTVITDNKKYNIIIDKCEDKNKIYSQGKCSCDNSHGYYSINYNNNYFNDKCYNNKTKPENFYLNKETNLYEMCYKNCKTCNINGNDEENNCTSCVSNYIFTPDINNTVNCVPQCKYYYYFNFFNIYSCTESYQCPIKENLLIRNKNKCINNCSKDNIYKYQYSGECLEKCPDNTITHKYKCEIQNCNSCSLSNFKYYLTIDDIINNNLYTYTKNYIDEFNYTDNHIIKYNNNDYSLVLYKNISCIKELSLNTSQIDFCGCYEKIKNIYKIEGDLLIGVLEKYIDNETLRTSYLLFNPFNGKRINAGEICKDEIIRIRRNILNVPGVDQFSFKFFAEQDINIFNQSDKFYTDICKHYISPNHKDIPLNLRLKIIYPNISLCENDCISEGIDLKEMEAICYCPFSDLSKNSFLSNTLKYNEVLSGIYSFISGSNIKVLSCIKVIFFPDHFKRCIGGFIIIGLIFIQTICALQYHYNGKNKTKQYIYNLIDSYKDSLINVKREPTKKKINKKKLKKVKINKSQLNSTKSFSIFSKYSNNIFIQNINSENNLNKKHIIKKSKLYFIKYLSTEPNEMDYDEAIEKDKRKFCEYFGETIKENQIIINTFFIKDNIKHKSIKIIKFVLYLDHYMLFNGLLYNETFLIDIYYSNDKSFSSSISRYYGHLIYIFFFMKVIKGLSECFFIEEKKIKGILKRGKNQLPKINEEINILIKKIEKYIIIFIIISYIIFIFSFIYICCFNDVYYYIRIEWINLLYIY